MAWILATIVLSIVIATWARDWGRGKWLASRHAHKRLWMAAYEPGCQRSKADEVLGWICDSFLLPDCSRYALRPSDRIWTIYRLQNPSCYDNMDMETLSLFFEWANLDPQIIEREDLTIRDIVVMYAGSPRTAPNTEQGVPPNA